MEGSAAAAAAESGCSRLLLLWEVLLVGFQHVQRGVDVCH